MSKPSNQFVKLNPALHDRQSFDCGEEDLNDFIQTKAQKHMKSGISQTMVLPSSSPLPNGKLPICAFYTVTPSSIERKTLPQQLAKKLPHYPVPVFLLAQLAVHSEYCQQGIGKITLIKSFEHFYHINTHMPAYAVVVDCLNDNAKRFYEKFGFKSLNTANDRARLYLPMKIIKQLFE